MLALAPDASSQKGAQSMSTPAKWSGMGVMPDVLWGECEGSGATPYRACVDLGETAYRCSCPSRKFPCKHALGLLLLWSADGVPAAGASPGWVTEWLAQRRARAAGARGVAPSVSAEPGASGDAPGHGLVAGDSGVTVSDRHDLNDDRHDRPARGDRHDPLDRAGGARGAGRRGAAVPAADGGEAARRAAQREQRVAAGLSELERWLADQIGHGLAGARRDAPTQWEELARRLVDAQAPGVAVVVSRLPRLLAEEDWPARLLGEYGLLHLLAVGYRRAGELPAPLRDTIRSRVGFPTSREEVLAGPVVRDRWHVLGVRDDEQDRLVSRRVWLRGHDTGRPALVLSFAPPGHALDASLVTGTTVDAGLAFYPGAAPLRALVAVRHRTMALGPPPGCAAAAAPAEIAAALAADPWLDSWPVVLGDVVPARSPAGWLLTDAAAVHRAGHDAGAAGVHRTGDDIGATVVRGAGAAAGSVAAAGEGDAMRGEAAGMPLHPSGGVPWRLLAVSGGRPVTVAAEWTPYGLRPLTVWDGEGQVVVL
ncbi:hypothetical protein Sme01_09770 [Sphaerisporangium melleum]|uniref:SWIM-type domain-containing protein n=1 Tax=Sphaerisporangium melleum TaxID=321316 RepID=A0A917QT40_9ACTN|nr:hypothetical protein GCM10007964_07840 [Sphaerisporangium melleum]GII68501.1 hypothetical protein Sme01_09770 [Sphaerisporangium melleum]